MNDYLADPALTTDLAVVGARVSVPDWRMGTVIGWTNGTITEARGTEVDPTGAYLVRLDSTGDEAQYFGYSLAAEQHLGPDADKACVQCGASGQVSAPLYARPHPRADFPAGGHQNPDVKATPCKYVRVHDRRFLPEDIIDGDIVSDDTRETVVDCSHAQDDDSSIDQAVRAIDEEGLTFEGSTDWASDPDGSRIVNYYTGERSELSAHLYGFTDAEQDEIITRVKGIR